jgi:hypothetical protein
LISDNIIVGVNKDAIFIDGGAGGGNNVVQNNTIGLALAATCPGQPALAYASAACTTSSALPPLSALRFRLRT